VTNHEDYYRLYLNFATDPNLPIPILGTAHHNLDIWHTVG